MTNKVFYSLLTLLLMGSVVLFYSLYSRQRELEEINEALIDISSRPVNSKKTTTLRMSEIESEGVVISPLIKLIDEKGDTVLLKDVIQDNNLVYKYSQTQCEACTDQQMMLIKQNLDLTYYKLILLTDYHSIRDIKVFKAAKKIDCPIYLIRESLPLNCENLGMPYYFSVNKNDFSVKNVFIPEKEHPEISVSFFNSLKAKQFK